MKRRASERHIIVNMIKQTYNERGGEPRVELDLTLQALDVLVGQGNLECLEVSKQMFDLPPTNNGEHVWGLLHQVCNSDYTLRKKNSDIWVRERTQRSYRR